MFYPPIEPYNSFHLKVDELHEIYVEETGNPDKPPILFLHGGPGGGISSDHRRYFDPKKWRVILFDQRGCGKSKPFGELKNNTTFHLVDDIEKIRKHLDLENFFIFGGSWGSTLALSYAICHPKNVLGLILRGIFLVRPEEIKWFYQDGAHRFYPEEWEKFLAPIPFEERDDLVSAYYKRLTSSNKKEVLTAAKAWSLWEGATSKLLKDPQMMDSFSDDDFSYAFARIECHYFYNNAFFKTDNWILENVDKIAHIKGVIVQGRYDMPCPPYSAYQLHKLWPNSELIMAEKSGHSASEPVIRDELIKKTNELVS